MSIICLVTKDQIEGYLHYLEILKSPKWIRLIYFLNFIIVRVVNNQHWLKVTERFAENENTEYAFAANCSAEFYTIHVLAQLLFFVVNIE